MPPYRVYGRKAFLNTDYVEDLDKLMSDKSVKRYIIRKKNNGSVNRDLLLRLLWPESQGLL